MPRLNSYHICQQRFWMPGTKKRYCLLSKTLMNSWLHLGIRCKFLPTQQFLC